VGGLYGQSVLAQDLPFTENSVSEEVSSTAIQSSSLLCPSCPNWWTFPFVWVVNSTENTVSKIETTSGCELGRYRTGPGTEDPSRLAVDREGDVWVLNRASSTAVKIALSPQDRDNDGPITTSQDTNRNCVIEPGEVLPWSPGQVPQDEAILMRISVGGGPRAVAVDRYNNVWIGGYDNNIGAGYHMAYHNGRTGQRLKVIDNLRYPYGALIDKKGSLWISNSGDRSITRINKPDTTPTIKVIPTPSNHYAYSITIDQEGYIYVTGFDSYKVSKYNPVTGVWVWSKSTAPYQYARAVAVDFFGDIWVTHTGSNAVTRHNAATGDITKVIGLGSSPIGIATAADGRLWVANYSSSSVMRINPRTETVELTHAPHPNPYAIGDFTGIIFNSITLPPLPKHPTYGTAAVAATETAATTGFIEILRDPNELPPIMPPLPWGTDPETMLPAE